MKLVQLIITFLLLTTPLRAQRFDPHTFQLSLDSALHGSSASAVVIDATSGKLLASYRLAAATPQEPGSTLKPLVAAVALKSGTVSAQTRVSCPGTLNIGRHNLKCSHPRAITIFDLQNAIAYSCNSWFAQLAKHMSPYELDSGLREYGVPPTALAATEEQRQLLTLGLEEIRVTPSQLAQAYRTLALQLDDNQLAPIRNGLFDSINFGMAHNAATPGLMLAGKTGTAPSLHSTTTHGLFAGIIYSPATREPKAVIVVTIPNGNGADAAALTKHFLVRWSGQ